MSGFCITQSKGFRVTFENGYAVSVQFGLGSYASNGKLPERVVGLDWEGESRKRASEGSDTAETALISPNGDLIALKEDSDTVQGYRTPSQVLELMVYAAGLPKP